MNIVLLSNLYRPYARGGAEIIAGRVAHELIARGHKVSLVSSMPFGGLWSLTPRVTEAQIEKIYRFFPLNLYHALSDTSVPFAFRALWHLVDLWNPQASWAVKKILDKEKPEVILTHNMKGLGLQTLRAIHQHGARHIHTVHDVQLSIPSGLLLAGQEESWLVRSSLRTWYERQVQRLMRSPDVVISPSRFLAAFYKERGFFPDSRVEILPNPAPDIVPPIRVCQTQNKKILRVLFAGQLEKHKGILTLLEVARRMEGAIELHIAGEGSLSEFVTERSNLDAHVHYHGFVSFEHLEDLLGICDVCVVPSLCYENSPTVIYESLQAGVPVVASHIGGVGELVQDGQNGFLVPPGDADALIRAFGRFLDSSWPLAKTCTQFQEEIQQHSLKAYVDRLEELMKEE
jgi:glycosyltransferase involved in cell wall biosynthesis